MSIIHSTNPGDGYALLGSVGSTTEEEVVHIVRQAHEAGKMWRKTPISDRVSILSRALDLFRERKEMIAQSVSKEMGMPMRYARDEVQYGLNYFQWYLDHAVSALSPEVTYETDSEVHTVLYEPKGVIAAITPWNYPFMLFVWACIQPLLAGNTVVWKISKEVILTGEIIASIMPQSTLPSGVWTEVFGDGKLGDFLTDQDIDGITFTGSTGVGRRLAEKAQKKGITAVMELGGSAPGIITADADITSVLETIFFMRFSNSGQMCDGLKRLIVHASRYEECIEKLREKLASKIIGDPLCESTDIGPLVSEHQLQELDLQLQDALDKGASILIKNEGENMPHGAYMPVYVLGDISRDMRVWKEEVFGPILPIVTYETYDEMIHLANDTEYGLGGYVFTKSREDFRCIAGDIETGMVQWNNVNYCIPQDPFGGYKASGIGREHGHWGFHELVNIKVISEAKENS